MLFSKQMSLIKEIAKSDYRAESWLGNSEFTYKGSYGHNVGDSLAGSRKLALKIWTSVSSLLPELIVLPVLFLGVLQLTFSHTIFSYIRLIQIVHKVYIYMQGLWSGAAIHTGLMLYGCEIPKRPEVLCDVGDRKIIMFCHVIPSGSAFNLINGGKWLSWVILLRMTVILRQIDLFLDLLSTVYKRPEHLIKLYG